MELLIKNFAISKDIGEEWIRENCYIAGGACVSNFTGSKINDVDIYFKSKQALINFMEKTGYCESYFSKGDDIWNKVCDLASGKNVEEFQVGKNKYKILKNSKTISEQLVTIYEVSENYNVIAEISEPLLEKQKWLFKNGYLYVLKDKNHFEVENGVFLGNKSITIKRNTPRGEMKYQFILRFYGSPKQVMNKTFDFQHCKIAYDLKNRKYIAEQKTFECLAKKEIVYVNSFYPISSIKRLFKYEKRGFKYSNDEFVKIIKDIHRVKVDNKFVIEDQIIGYYEDFDYNDVFGNEDTIFRFLK